MKNTNKDTIIISLEWKKSNTWGQNPIASGVRLKDGRREFWGMTRSITGCGFDKQGTAIAEVLNSLLSNEEISKTNAYGVRNGVIDGACGTCNDIMACLGYECLSVSTKNSTAITYYKQY
jgi:hypothetical protein